MRRPLSSFILACALAQLLACSGSATDASGDAPIDAGLGTARDAGAPTPGCGQAFEPGTTLQYTLPETPRAGASYTLHVPPSYDGSPMPLVLNLHGFVNDGADQAAISRNDALADQAGFIVAYPNGRGALTAWNAGDCCAFDAKDRDDLAYLDEILEHIQSQLCIDRSRVYAMGFSNGGFMAYLLACERSTTFAALGSVAGVFGIDPLDCNPERIVPMQHLHGTSDLIVPFDGGEPAGFALIFSGSEPPTFRSVQATRDIWSSVAECEGGASIDFQEADTTCESYAGCKGDAEYRVCTIEGGGHTWPGGDAQALGSVFGLLSPFLGRTSTTLDASAEHWRFFQRHSL